MRWVPDRHAHCSSQLSVDVFPRYILMRWMSELETGLVVSELETLGEVTWSEICIPEDMTSMPISLTIS